MAEETTMEAGEETPGQAGEQPSEEQGNGQGNEEQQGQAGSPEPQGEKPGESGKGEGGEETPDWRESITDPKLKEFASRFTSPQDAAKAALEFRQKLSNAIVPPGKDASDEEVAEFNKRLGVPDSPDGYEIELPDDELPEGVDPERLTGDLDRFKEAMHEKGARPNEVQAAIDWYYGEILQGVKDAQKQYDDAYQKAEADLRTEWGDDYDANLEHANRAMKQFGGDDLVGLFKQATVNGTPLGSHPDVVKAFAQIGRRIGEAGLKIAMGEGEQQKTEQSMDDLTRQAHEAMQKGDRKEADRLFKEREDLAKKFYGNE